MVLLRITRLVVLVLLGSGWGLLPKMTDLPSDQPGSIRLTEASHYSDLK